jgi:phosphate transport system substrate-binding protein
VGLHFSYTPIVTGTATEYSASGLPPWLRIDSARGVVDGTPPDDAANRNFSFDIAAVGSQGARATQHYTLRVAAGPISTPIQTTPSSGVYDLILTGSNTIGGVDRVSQKGLARDLINGFCKWKWPGGALMDDGLLTVPGKDAKERVITYKLPTGEMKRVLIQPHGSGTSEDALRSTDPRTRADIGMSSSQRPHLQNPPPEWNMTFEESVIALDAVAIIVNPSNPIEELDLEQIRNIFGPNPAIRQWDGIAPGFNGEIKTFGRDNKSGTTECFREITGISKALEAAGQKKDAAFPYTGPASSDLGYLGYEDTNTIVEKVRRDPLAIGFVGRAASLPPTVKALAIRPAPGISAFSPNGPTIRTREYCLARELYFYYRTGDLRPMAADFIGFCLDDKGQAIADDTGFIGFTPANMLAPPTFGDRAPQALRTAVANCDRVVISFTFRFGVGNALDTISAQNLTRLILFLHRPEIARRRMVIVGTSDSIGNAGRCMQISRDRAANFARLLQTKGIENPISRTLGFGKEYLLYDDKNDSNSREAQRNRRVDIYLER